VKITVIGATGHIGGLIAHEAQSRGHEVTGISPHGSGMSEGIPMRSGDVRQPGTFVDAIRGEDAVVAAVVDRAHPDGGLIPAAARALVEAVPQAGAGRLLWCGGGGNLEAEPGVRFIDQPGFPAEFRSEAMAQAEALTILQSAPQPLEWTYVSPPPALLMPGPKLGGYRVAGGDKPVVDSSGEARINDSDYASAIVDELEQHRFNHQRFTVGY
jgi:putative NADH-flavin reductase